MSDARWSATSGSHENDGADIGSVSDRTQRIDQPEGGDGVAATQSLPTTGRASGTTADGGTSPFQPGTAPTAWSAESGSAYAADAGTGNASTPEGWSSGRHAQESAPVSGGTSVPAASAPAVTVSRPWYKRAWARGVAGVAVVLASFGLGWASHDVTSTSTSTSQQQGGPGGQGGQVGQMGQDGQMGQQGQSGQGGQGGQMGQQGQSGQSDSSGGVLQDKRGQSGGSGQTAPTDGATDAANTSADSNT